VTPEEFARWEGVDERFVKIAADAIRGERQPNDHVTGEPRFAHLVSRWHAYRAATAARGPSHLRGSDD